MIGHHNKHHNVSSETAPEDVLDISPHDRQAGQLAAQRDVMIIDSLHRMVGADPRLSALIRQSTELAMRNVSVHSGVQSQGGDGASYENMVPSYRANSTPENSAEPQQYPEGGTQQNVLAEQPALSSIALAETASTMPMSAETTASTSNSGVSLSAGPNDPERAARLSSEIHQLHDEIANGRNRQGDTGLAA